MDICYEDLRVLKMQELCLPFWRPSLFFLALASSGTLGNTTFWVAQQPMFTILQFKTVFRIMALQNILWRVQTREGLRLLWTG